jgi:hypothetical protein
MVCLLLTVFWIRSYWYFDIMEGKLPYHKFSLMSVCGQTRLTLFANPHPNDWDFSSSSVKDRSWTSLAVGSERVSQIYLPSILLVTWTSDSKVNWFPTLLPIYLFGLGAVLPGVKLPLRFRLRSMLIVTTLVSVALILMIWSVQMPYELYSQQPK